MLWPCLLVHLTHLIMQVLKQCTAGPANHITVKGSLRPLLHFDYCDYQKAGQFLTGERVLQPCSFYYTSGIDTEDIRTCQYTSMS